MLVSKFFKCLKHEKTVFININVFLSDPALIKNPSFTNTWYLCRTHPTIRTSLHLFATEDYLRNWIKLLALFVHVEKIVPLV